MTEQKKAEIHQWRYWTLPAQEKGMTDELVKRLIDEGAHSLRVRDEAATAIEAMQARLQQQTDYFNVAKDAATEVLELRTQLAQVTRERDGAVAILIELDRLWSRPNAWGYVTVHKTQVAEFLAALKESP